MDDLRLRILEALRMPSTGDEQAVDAVLHAISASGEWAVVGKTEMEAIRESIRQLFKDPMCIGDVLKIPESMRSDIWRMVDDVFDEAIQARPKV